MVDELMFLQQKAPVGLSGETFSARPHAGERIADAMNPVFLESPVLESCARSPETYVTRHAATHVTAKRNPEPYGGSSGLGGSRAPDALGRLRETLGLDAAQAEQLAMLLRESAGPSPHRHIEAGGRIRYFGHACLALQTPEGAVVTDPFISADGGTEDHYTLDDLPDFIDLVLVTHGHQDPIVLETLLQLRGRIGTIVAPRASRTSRASPGPCADPDGPSTGLYLSRLGFPVVEADDYDEFPFPGGRVVATPFLGERAAQDPAAMDPDADADADALGLGLPAFGEGATYWVELAGRSAFIGTDSSGTDPAPYRCVRQLLGTADYAFLGMERDSAPPSPLHRPPLYLPGRERPSSHPRKRKPTGLSAAQAATITTELGAGEAYVYAVGEEPWPGNLMAATRREDTYEAEQIDEFMMWCADHGIRAGHLHSRQERHW